MMFGSSNFQTRRPLVLSNQIHSGSNQHPGCGTTPVGGDARNLWHKNNHKSASLNKNLSRPSHRRGSQLLGKRAYDALQNLQDQLSASKIVLGSGNVQRPSGFKKVQPHRFTPVVSADRQSVGWTPVNPDALAPEKIKLLTETGEIKRHFPRDCHGITALHVPRVDSRAQNQNTEWTVKQPKSEVCPLPNQGENIPRNTRSNAANPTFFEWKRLGKIQLTKSNVKSDIQNVPISNQEKKLGAK